MSVFTIKMVGHVIEINSIYNYSCALLNEYITEEPATIRIHIDNNDIEQEAEKVRLSGRSHIPINSRLEPAVICRKLADTLIDYDILLMHGAVIGIGANAYMFTGKSGVGKTTHIRKWLRQCQGAYVVNGDKPFVVIDQVPKACGTPWSGKEEMYNNVSVPLKAIILMERNENNIIKQVSFAEAFPTLFEQVYHPNSEDKMRKTIRLLNKLYPYLSFWKFGCNNFKEDCFETVYKAIVGKEKC